MNKTGLSVLSLVLITAWAAPGQQSGKYVVHGAVGEHTQPSAQALTNDSIIKLVRAGLSEGTIIAMVKTQPGKYSLSADDIIRLKRARVPENIIAAMIEKSTPGSTPVSALAPAI